MTTKPRTTTTHEDATPKTDIDMNYLTEHITALLQKTDQIITGDETITIKPFDTNTSSGAVAYADIKAKTIHINMPQLITTLTNGIPIHKAILDEQLLTAVLAHLKATNYHELAHILYTNVSLENSLTIAESLNLPAIKRASNPSEGNQHELNLPLPWLPSIPKLKYAANHLEDPRIETIFSAIFPPTKKYFINHTLTAITHHKSPLHYLQLYGRKFINPTITAQYRTQFIQYTNASEEQMERVDTIIDEYISEYSKETRERLIVDFTRLLDELGLLKTNDGQSPESQHIHSTASILGAGKNSNGGRGGAKQNPLDPQHNRNKQRIQQNIDNHRDPNTPNPPTTIKEELERNTNDINKECQKDATNIIRGIQGAGQGQYHIETVHFTPTAENLATATRLRTIFRRLRNGLEEHYALNQRRGRFDINKVRTMELTKRYDPESFKQYKPSLLDKTHMGIGILIDTSGSISDTQYQQEAGASWSIDKAAHAVGSKTMVSEFSDGHEVKKQLRSPQASWSRTLSGGTDPTSGIIETITALTNAQRSGYITTPVLMIVTDGDWSGESSEEEIQKANARGFHTVLIDVSGRTEQTTQARHHCTHYVGLTGFDELETHMRRIISDIQHKERGKIAMEMGR